MFIRPNIYCLTFLTMVFDCWELCWGLTVILDSIKEYGVVAEGGSWSQGVGAAEFSSMGFRASLDPVQRLLQNEVDPLWDYFSYPGLGEECPLLLRSCLVCLGYSGSYFGALGTLGLGCLLFLNVIFLIKYHFLCLRHTHICIHTHQVAISQQGKLI